MSDLALGTDAHAASTPVVGHLLGDPAAPSRVVVYGTFECLHCRRAWPALRALAEDPASGVAVEWRHFARAGAFPNATTAALAAEAADAQGAFWAMHDALMAAPSPLWPERVDGVAAALGLDLSRLHRDAAAGATRARVEAQRAAADADGVRGTPAAFLDGDPVDVDDLDVVRERLQAR